MVQRRILLWALNALLVGSALFMLHCGGGGGAPDDATMAPDSDSPPGDGGVDAEPVQRDAAPVDAAPQPRPEIYPTDRTHSPITPYVAARLAEVLALNPSSQRDVFIKVGDSISASTNFLNCFAGSNVDLDSHTALHPGLTYFLATQAGSTTSFDRSSDVVEVGRTAYWAVTGSPSPVNSELSAIHPAAAIVMFGTNDIGWFGSDHEATLQWYYDHYYELVHTLLNAGVIPILSTIPPRDDSPSLDGWVGAFNAVIRGLAQGRQIPLVDYHREMAALADHGLAGDELHPNVYWNGESRGCVFTPDALLYGYNVRNLTTLEALDRVRGAALEDTTPLDPQELYQLGTGTTADPFIVQGTVYTHLANTEDSTARDLNFYGGCGSPADETGPELTYEMTLTQPARVRALVLDVGSSVDVDVHLLDSTASEAGCLARGDTIVEMDLAPGTYYWSLDTYVSGGVELSGEYLFVVLVCEAGVAGCG